MPTYVYSRQAKGGSTGGYNIDNPDRNTGEPDYDQIYLASEIETALPGKGFRVCCYGGTCDIIFDAPLQPAEETTLTDTVNDHKNNV